MSILYLIGSNAATLRRDKAIYYSRISIIILISSIIININNYMYEFFEKEIGLFGGFYIVNINTHTFHIFILIITALIIQLNGFYPRKIWTEKMYYIFNRASIVYKNNLFLNKMSEQFRILEYSLIILFIVIGGTFLLASSDLISIFISLELQSYGLYILCAVYKNSERSVSGGIMYFLLGGLSSCFILLASALLYGNSGNTSFDAMHIISNISDSFDKSEKDVYNSYYINFSLVIMAVGLLFKISAAPFHFWSPDVYDSIPTIVTTFVAIFAKITVLVLILHLIKNSINNIYYYNVMTDITADNNYIPNNKFSWIFTLVISSLLSLIIGSILGLTQSRIKRLFAYSTISHLGFILLALSLNNIESLQSFMFYLTQYSISNLNAFLILLIMGNLLYIYKDEFKQNYYNVLDKKNSPVQLISQLKGFFHINPFLSLSLAITLFSFAGIPPLVGFFGKQMVLISAIDSGYIFISIVAILTSVISAYYYLMLVKQIFFEKADYHINDTLKKTELIDTGKKHDNNIINFENIKLSSNISFFISIITLIIALFLIYPEEWLNIVKILSVIGYN